MKTPPNIARARLVEFVRLEGTDSTPEHFLYKSIFPHPSTSTRRGITLTVNCNDSRYIF